MAPAPDDPLATYRAKRRFDSTAEPSGAPVAAPTATVEGAYVVHRHRARRLHYDLRLEIDGVLVSWAVPKGPTLDPAARRLAVHVEDHPLEYGDFEGVIPSGDYGAGDVIVWDRGTYRSDEGTATDGLARGDLHLELTGEKLRGRFVLVRTSGRSRAGGDEGDSWLLLHKRDEHAVDGWDPEDHPRSVRSGLTNDEVAARGVGALDGPGDPVGPAAPIPTWPDATADELAALDALGAAGTWSLGGDEVELTNLDKVLFPAGPDGVAVTKRDLVRYWAQVAPHALPYLWDRPVNLQRFPDGADAPGFWNKAVAKRAPSWLATWDRPDAKEGKTVTHLVADRPAALAYLANLAALELHPWTAPTRSHRMPTWALIDLDPGPRTTWDELLVLARLHRTALDHLGVAAMPKVTGKRGIQIWIPVADGLAFEDTSRWVQQVSEAIGATVPELVSWAWGTEDRKGLARLDYTQNAHNKTLVAPWSPRPAAGARCRCRSPGTSSTTPASVPTGGPSARRSTASPPPATRSVP
ncbi:MAG: DNA polymerase ligase N-terminal domain-containing protein [Acidimicrobiales bacterium]